VRVSPGGVVSILVVLGRTKNDSVDDLAWEPAAERRLITSHDHLIPPLTGLTCSPFRGTTHISEPPFIKDISIKSSSV
jgi:hypothetical protein